MLATITQVSKIPDVLLHFSFSGLYVYFKILSVLSANDIVLTIVIAEEVFLSWSYS